MYSLWAVGEQRMRLHKKKRAKRGPKLERILRVLANNATGNLSRYRISKEADCSQQWGQRVVQRLEEMGLVEGTTVRNFQGLIKYWQERKLLSKKRNYVVKRGLDLLKSTNLRFAVTTYLAENLYQGHLFPSRIDIYIDSREEEEWSSLLSKHGFVGHGNFRTLVTDNHVFYRSINREDLILVSPPQLIVDLLQEGGPCVEAASMMIRKMSMDV